VGQKIFSKVSLRGYFVAVAFCGLLTLLLVAGETDGEPARNPSSPAVSALQETSSVAYGTAAHQLLDVYAEPDTGVLPVVIHLGATPHDIPAWVLELTEMGWAVVDVGYATSNGVVALPEAVDDVRLATEWVQEASKRYGFVANNVVVVGEGVGGLIGGLAIAQSTSGSAVSGSPYSGFVSSDAPLDTRVAWWDMGEHASLAAALGCEMPCPADRFENYSLVNKLGSTFPPSYIAANESRDVARSGRESFNRSLREKSEQLSPMVWLDNFDAVANMPSNRIQLQLFFTELSLVAIESLTES
jgi:hypothetical protein